MPLASLPPDLLVSILVIACRLDATEFGQPTRRIGRLASLARFLTVPARIASLHTVEASEALANELEAEPAISNHFRIVALRAPSVDDEAAVNGGHTRREMMMLWPRWLARWRDGAVGPLLANPGSATHLVLDGPIAAFDRDTIDALIGHTWCELTIGLAETSMGSGSAARDVLVTLFDAVAPSLHALTVVRFDGQRLPTQFLPDWSWPRLRRMVARKSDAGFVDAVTRNAPSLVALDADELGGLTTLPPDVRFTPRWTVGSDGQPHMVAVDQASQVKGVRVLDYVLDQGVPHSNPSHRAPAALHTLRGSMRCDEDLRAVIRLQTAALASDRWTDEHIPQVIELVWIPDPRPDDVIDSPAARMQADLVPLRERCAARGVRFELFLHLARVL